jgi:hypothetical protein
MLEAFHNSYPTGSLISELVQIYHGKYIVKVSVQVNNTTYATGMSSAETIEEAEDNARQRALSVLNLTSVSVQANIGATPSKSIIEVSTQPKVNEIVLEHSQVDTQATESTPVETFSQTKNVAEAETAIKTELAVEQPSYSKNVGEMPEDSLAKITAKIETTITEAFPEAPVEEFTFESQIEAAKTPLFEQPEEFTQLEEASSFDDGLFSTTLEDEFPAVTSSNVMPFTPRSYTPIEPVPQTTTTTASTSKRKKKTETIDQSDDIAKIGVEMQRLGWTTDQGREHLINTYNKRSRHLLSTEEIQDFLRYLESQPTPIDPLPLEPTF